MAISTLPQGTAQKKSSQVQPIGMTALNVFRRIFCSLSLSLLASSYKSFKNQLSRLFFPFPKSYFLSRAREALFAAKALPQLVCVLALLLLPAVPAHAHSPANPYPVNSWQYMLFNSTASLLGLPGLVSPVDGLADEGLGFHADGTTRRADGSSGTDSTSRFGGRRAGAYMRSGIDGGMYSMNRPWLYDDLMGFSRGADGRIVRPGDAYSGRRDVGRYGSTLFGDGTGNMTQSLMQRGISAGIPA